jgi:hypothetical protein
MSPYLVTLYLGTALLSAQSYYPLTPCRIADTRQSSPIAARASRDFQIAGLCGVPAGATAFVLVVTAVPPGPLGYLTIWPTGQTMPLASSLNDNEGQIRNAYPTVAAGAGWGISIYANDKTDVVIDVTGYFAPILFVDWEVPAGLVDGTNSTLTLAAAPNPPSSLKCWWNEYRLVPNVTISSTGNTITLLGPASSPALGTVIGCEYRK